MVGKYYTVITYDLKLEAEHGKIEASLAGCYAGFGVPVKAGCAGRFNFDVCGACGVSCGTRGQKQNTASVY